MHAVETQGTAVGVMQYVTEYKLSSSMDGVTWKLYEETGQVKVNSYFILL